MLSTDISILTVSPLGEDESGVAAYRIEAEARDAQTGRTLARYVGRDALIWPHCLSALPPVERSALVTAAVREIVTRTSARHGVRFVRGAGAVIGRGHHRSGWPDAYARIVWAIGGLDADLLFDDCVEQSYCWAAHRPVRLEPWAGVFHVPPDLPAWADDRERLEVFTGHPEFRQSLPHLRVAIALSEHLAARLRPRLGCPVAVVRHPCERPALRWSAGRFAASEPTLVQLGTYYRNLRLIHTLDVPGWKRVRLMPAHRPAAEQDALYRGPRGREIPWVTDLPRIADADYDELLSRAVVVQEVFAASASNGVLDCLARATPLVVNRHPAVEEYLGGGYPLFWDDRREIPGLVARAVEGHEYLARLDPPWLSGEAFGRSVRRAVARVFQQE